jgi:alpha-glucosidase
MADGGYDVADYRGIDPRLGSLADADELLREAHENGIHVLIDLVPNHTSWSHPWFHDVVAAGPWSPARARYIFRDGRGPDGDEPPNNWQSAFGSSAWTRVVEPNGRPEQWYLHLFAPEQPDLDWENPEVRAEFESILRFWFDRGFDGVRIDVADALVKDPALPDMPPELSGAAASPASTRTGTDRGYTRFTGRGADSRTATSRDAFSLARSVSTTRNASRVTCARHSSTRRSTSRTWRLPGSRPRCAM